ncbi:MAG: SdiA-regulated domain-containing protein, partial [Ignavibacterium album]|nr:SdiA-regulated domain-containing protein [Ignavibacterium album]
YTLDISDIYYDEICNCIWIISDESKRILKLSTTGELLKQWEIPFTKGEGITIVNEKIYVVNDSNSKMYVFQKPN